MDYWMIVKSVFSLHAGYSLRALNNKRKFLVLVGKNWTELNLFFGRMSNALGDSGIEKLGGDCLGVIHWPYISKSWSSRDKLGVMASHYEVVSKSCPQLPVRARRQPGPERSDGLVRRLYPGAGPPVLVHA